MQNQSPSPLSLPDIRNTIFAKTPKGRTEIELRSNALNRKQRTVLIMLDGNKRMRSINTMLPEPELVSILEFLHEQAFIQKNQAPASGTKPVATAPVIPAAAPALIDEPEKIREIKDFMTTTAQTYLGLMAADVVRRVEHAKDAAQLMSVLGHWHMALLESKHGKHFAALYLEQIKAGLRGESATETAPATS